MVSVLYNSEEVLPNFLDSLKSQTYPNVIHVFVDNASTDRSSEIVSQFDLPNSYLVSAPCNTGVAAGNNLGIRFAREHGAEYILLQNNDTTFSPTFIETLISQARFPGVGVLAPAVEATYPQGTIWFAGGKIRKLAPYLTKHNHAGAPIERFRAFPDISRIGYAPTCSLLVPAGVFDTVGLMDHRFFVYGDDVDFMLRLRSAGIPVHLTIKEVVLHRASSLTGGDSSYFGKFWQSRNWLLLIRKHGTTLTLYRALCYIAAWQVARVLTGRDSIHGARQRAKGFMAGLRLNLEDGCADHPDVKLARQLRIKKDCEG